MAPKAGHIEDGCLDINDLTQEREAERREGYQSAEGTANPPALTTVGTSSFSASASASM